MDSQEPSKTSRMEQNAIHVLIPPIKVEVSGGVVDLGTLDFNDVSRDIGQITIDFSSMNIIEIYAL